MARGRDHGLASIDLDLAPNVSDEDEGVVVKHAHLMVAEAG